MDKHIIPLLIALTAILATTSCTDEIAPASTVSTMAFTPKGELVDACLNLNVDELKVTAATKTQSEEVEDDIEAERAIYDLWIFQYDVSASDDESSQPLISTPRYLTIEEDKQSELANLSVKLSDNDDDESVIYVVANTDNSTWAQYAATSGIYEGFRTVAELKANTIPTPKPQQMKYDYDAEQYVVYEDGDKLSIPMSGCSDKVTVSEGTEVKVNVQRMFAKLRIQVDLNGFESDGYSDPTVYNVTVGNIPEYSTVGTLFSDESSEAASYDKCERWLTRAFSDNEKVGDESGGSGVDGEQTAAIYPYVIYVPENIQGESSEAVNTKALSVTVDIKAKTNDDNGVTMGPYSFTAYPGSNVEGNEGNYNIKRNCVYDITMKISDLVDAEDPLPSANCIICLSGQTTAFYPYCREDKGGGYTFTDYLDYSYSTSDASKRIDRIEILWQSEATTTENKDGGFIGNNDKDDKVWIDPAPTSGSDDDKSEAEKRRKIYVTIPENEIGNAVIAAYNSDNEIIWSWHIWSRLEADDPGNEANGVLYYTYDWDSNGIKYDQPRVAGYTVMNCNLGALQNLPNYENYNDYESAIPTYGNFYQWGRKDPFPAVKNVSQAQLSDVYDGGDYDTDHVGKYYNNSNNEVEIKIDSLYEESTALFHYYTDYNSVEYVGLKYSIQNPTVFMRWKGRTDNDERDSWSYDAFYGFGQFNRTLWGSKNDYNEANYTKRYETTYYDKYAKCNLYITDTYGPEKTIFDPCPYGWRVSPPDLWLGFTNTGLNPVAELGTLDDQTNYDPEKTSASGFTMYMADWKQGSTSYFPVQGAIHSNGKIYRINVCGNYTNAIQDYHHYVNVTHFHDEIGSFAIFCTECRYTSLGAPVRCVRFGSVSN